MAQNFFNGGGEEMPIYGDDQCVECGAVRVAGSKLCPQCLVRERDILEKEVSIKMAIIWAQKARIANLEALLKEAAGYGFKKNQENVHLRQEIEGLYKEIESYNI
jgi:uncharacterized OB-fold protein